MSDSPSPSAATATQEIDLSETLKECESVAQFLHALSDDDGSEAVHRLASEVSRLSARLEEAERERHAAQMRTLEVMQQFAKQPSTLLSPDQNQ